MKLIRTIALMAAAVLAAVQTFAREAEWNEKKHTIFFGGGYGCIISNVSVPGGNIYTDGSIDGFAARGGYTYSLNRLVGLGGMIDLFRSSESFQFTSTGWDVTDVDCRFFLTYVAPQVTLNLPFGSNSRWSAEIRAGVGALAYNEKVEVEHVSASGTWWGWCSNADLGIEWRLNSTVGFTVSGSYLGGQIRQSIEHRNGTTEKIWNKVERLYALAGVKIHL